MLSISLIFWYYWGFSNCCNCLNLVVFPWESSSLEYKTICYVIVITQCIFHTKTLYLDTQQKMQTGQILHSSNQFQVRPVVSGCCALSECSVHTVNNYCLWSKSQYIIHISPLWDFFAAITSEFSYAIHPTHIPDMNVTTLHGKEWNQESKSTTL